MNRIALIPLTLTLAACTPPAADTPAMPSASASSAAESASADSRLSQYTSLTDCRVTKSNPDEAGYRVSECPGVAGFGVQKIESDGRANLTIQPPNGQPQSLKLGEHGSGGFSDLGENAEWRGDPGAAPDAMIVRYKVIEDGATPERWTSYLLVVSLKGTPCVTARIAPGPQQNDHARTAADGPLPCLA